MRQDDFSRSLWSSLTPARRPAPALEDDIAADVLICGAGFLGLSTALHLAEHGRSVALVEAEEAGFGASGRNTGFVVPSLKTAIGPQDVAARMGAAHAERLVSLVGDSGQIVFDLIRRLSIGCAAEQTGWMQPAHSAPMLATLERRCAEWQRLGKSVEMLDAAETRARIGTDAYPGALFVPSGGQINPLAYARGLAEACIAAGVNLYEGTAVTGLDRRGEDWVARTAGGSVRAPRVLLATNALVGKLVPAVDASLIPARVFQIATQAYPDDTRRRILATRTPVADTRRHTFAARWSPDGRLLTGGIVMLGPNRMARARSKFARRLAAFFPGIPKPEACFAWTGVIAVTMDPYPRYIAVAPGLDALIGCNGRGVALTTSLGQALALHYAEDRPHDRFVLPREKPAAIPMRSLAELAPSFWLPWSEFRDGLESRREASVPGN